MRQVAGVARERGQRQASRGCRAPQLRDRVAVDLDHRRDLGAGTRERQADAAEAREQIDRAQPRECAGVGAGSPRRGGELGDARVHRRGLRAVHLQELAGADLDRHTRELLDHVAVARQHLRARPRRHDRAIAAIVDERDDAPHRRVLRERVGDQLELAARRARRDDERDHHLGRGLADDHVAQFAGARALVVGDQAGAFGGAAQPRGDLVDHRRDDATAERVDDVMAARRVRPEHEPAVRAGAGDVLALVAIAELGRRRPPSPRS